jgi:predicted SAM-dependent methyltransferase
VTAGLTSIVIPAYQHAAIVSDAVRSALAQTAPVEVIVIDDGSTDDTLDAIDQWIPEGGAPPHYPVRVYQQVHAGPSSARNRGLEEARGEFVMFLDADDIIAPTKVERQLAAFTDAIGWVLCDVRIKDAGRGHTELASERYDYPRKALSGWIDKMLEPANFIPIMSPLVRRSVLASIRFQDTIDGTPEDWRFWQKVAAVARVRYVPEVLATYRKQKTGRNRLPKAARAIEPNIDQPLRLNLGCGTPGTRSWHPIKGFVNLDKSLDWRFEEGLPQFEDGSVAGITVSHALMYVAEPDWPGVFRECYRVLAPGGVLRITEDETLDPTSARYGGWKGSEPAITLTHPAMLRQHLERAGFVAHDVTKDTTQYRDRSLCQAQHGDPVCFIEGVKPSVILFAPHADDETLFAAFTILKYRPAVVVCYGSERDYGDTATREAETRDALNVLGGGFLAQWNGGDLEAQMRALEAQAVPTLVFAPDRQASHPDHVAVHDAAVRVFGDRVTTYHTYDTAGKVRSDRPVPFEPVWVQQKLRALSRYTSQLTHPRAHQFFTWDLAEFYGEAL